MDCIGSIIFCYKGNGKQHEYVRKACGGEMQQLSHVHNCDYSHMAVDYVGEHSDDHYNYH